MTDQKQYPGAPCPTCKRERIYKTATGAAQSEGRNCRRCANSISAGGKGAFGVCFDCGGERDYPPSNSLCKACHVKRGREYHAKVYRFAKYGITKEQFEAMFKGCCDICGLGLAPNKAHIDHCHATGRVRGVLCNTCNKGLGLFRDQPELLETAAEYLRKSK